MKIRLDDLQNPQIHRFLQSHLDDMASHSPPESNHALDVDALRGPTVAFFSAWDDSGSALLGCGALKALDARHAEIKSMRTDPAQRRRGVARALLQHLVDEARRRGFERLSLETGSMAAFGPAHALYQRFGFVDCPPFGGYRADPNSVFMTLQLQRHAVDARAATAQNARATVVAPPAQPRHEQTNVAAATADTARTALACLDLTSLNDGDTDADIEALCVRAQGRFGNTAAVCVWPRFAALARQRLPRAIKVAAVANFPAGGSDIERAVRDVRQIVDAGADEVDVVLPYRDLGAAAALLAAVRRACDGLTLKVILETGELREPALIDRAAQIALDAGADFLKTSTGKTTVSATPAAARLLLQAIRDGGHAGVGFKPAGGIRTVADAAAYIALTAEYLGAVTPQRLRIGASGLLNDIEAVLGGGGDDGGAAAKAAADY